MNEIIFNATTNIETRLIVHSEYKASSTATTTRITRLFALVPTGIAIGVRYWCNDSSIVDVNYDHTTNSFTNLNSVLSYSIKIFSIRPKIYTINDTLTINVSNWVISNPSNNWPEIGDSWWVGQLGMSINETQLMWGWYLPSSITSIILLEYGMWHFIDNLTFQNTEDFKSHFPVYKTIVDSKTLYRPTTTLTSADIGTNFTFLFHGGDSFTNTTYSLDNGYPMTSDPVNGDFGIVGNKSHGSTSNFRDRKIEDPNNDTKYLLGRYGIQSKEIAVLQGRKNNEDVYHSFLANNLSIMPPKTNVNRSNPWLLLEGGMPWIGSISVNDGYHFIDTNGWIDQFSFKLNNSYYRIPLNWKIKVYWRTGPTFSGSNTFVGNTIWINNHPDSTYPTRPFSFLSAVSGYASAGGDNNIRLIDTSASVATDPNADVPHITCDFNKNIAGSVYRGYTREGNWERDNCLHNVVADPARLAGSEWQKKDIHKVSYDFQLLLNGSSQPMMYTETGRYYRNEGGSVDTLHTDKKNVSIHVKCRWELTNLPYPPGFIEPSDITHSTTFDASQRTWPNQIYWDEKEQLFEDDIQLETYRDSRSSAFGGYTRKEYLGIHFYLNEFGLIRRSSSGVPYRAGNLINEISEDHEDYTLMNYYVNRTDRTNADKRVGYGHINNGNSYGIDIDTKIPDEDQNIMWIAAYPEE